MARIDEDEVGEIDTLETMRALLEAHMVDYRLRMLYIDMKSTVVGVLAGALLFEETDDPKKVRACCREALFRLDGGLSQEELLVIDDPESIRGYLIYEVVGRR